MDPRILPSLKIIPIRSHMQPDRYSGAVEQLRSLLRSIH
jgi:hypothetical protein